MKQLLLDTRHIIATGNKRQPVMVRRTWGSIVYHLTFAVLLIAYLTIRLCSKDTHYDIWFYVLAIASIAAIIYLIGCVLRRETPVNTLDTDDFVCRQQYALYIMKTRVKNLCLVPAFISICLSGMHPAFVYAGVVFGGAFFLSIGYFNQQILQASRMEPDLNLKPRIETVIGVTPPTRRLETVALAAMVLAIGMAVYVGVMSIVTDNLPLLICCIVLAGCPAGVTFSLRKMLRQPISVADEEDLQEVHRDRWIIPTSSLCINILCAAVSLVLAFLL